LQQAFNRDDEDDYNGYDEKRDTKDYDRDDTNTKSQYGQIVKAIITNTSAVMQVIIVEGLINFNMGFNSFKKKFENKTEDSTLFDDHDDEEHEDLIEKNTDTVSSSQTSTSSHGETDFIYHSRYNGSKSKKFTIN
jgi:hypothetical protein